MSHNLALTSNDDELSLVQTPTEVTFACLGSGGQAGAIRVYEHWLRGCAWEGFSWMEDGAPGCSWDLVTRHVAMIDAFLAFAPGARFRSD